ncbi:LOW QUALITY PROTEIN: transmembrane and immunoglobulin domain-containing protein 2 [Pelecanus crispus]|uniref:LOW QUALITY PROTEIN: transmembrane and immunoglobulin domain-containing protein 2 n=1 Tax=Pelecanus crispus TaxID=36300 RepID=UPI003F5D0DC8
MWGLGILILLFPAAGALQVSQDPSEAWVTVGGSVALGCQVLTAGPWDLLRLEWVKDTERKVLCATRLHPAALAPPNSCTPRFHLAWHPPCATLSLQHAQGDDAGHYVCRVTLEIPRHDTATGNGTLLSVSTASDGGHQAGLVWGLVGALGGTALLLGLAFLGHWCWRRNSDTGIYMNVLPASAQPPPEAVAPTLVMESRAGEPERDPSVAMPPRRRAHSGHGLRIGF